jgi:hypothetical protein
MSCERVADGIPPAVLLVHGQLCGDDLLVVRIGASGFVLPPLIIFHDTAWDRKEFCQIIDKEKARMPPEGKVEVDFGKDKEGLSVLYKIFGTGGYCVRDAVQACVILPLHSDLKIADTGEYHVRDDVQAGDILPSGFESEIADNETAVDRQISLLKLLDLQTLLTDVQSKNEISCICGNVDDRKADAGRSNMMILCDNTKCKYGWYHMECVGLKDAFRSDEWYCESCTKLSENARAKTTYDNGSFKASTYQASDERIQLARTMGKVWKKYPQPTLEKMLKVVQSMDKGMDWEGKIPIRKLEEEEYGRMLRCRKVLQSTPQRDPELE